MSSFYSIYNHHYASLCASVSRNRTNKMAPLLHFVNGRSHIDVKVQRMTMSYDQS